MNLDDGLSRIRRSFWRLLHGTSDVDDRTTVSRRGRDHHEVRIGSDRFRVFTELMVGGPFDFVIDRTSVRPVDPAGETTVDRYTVIRALCRWFDRNRYTYDFY